MALTFLNDYDFDGKKVIARFDFNVPLDGNKIKDTTRVDRALQQGRPAVASSVRVDRARKVRGEVPLVIGDPKARDPEGPRYPQHRAPRRRGLGPAPHRGGPLGAEGGAEGAALGLAVQAQ